MFARFDKQKNAFNLSVLAVVVWKGVGVTGPAVVFGE